MVKVAVVGYGNMGKRHIDSLLTLGNGEILIVRRDASQPVDSRHEGIPIVGSLNDAIAQGASAVVIANVTSAHASTLDLALRRGLAVLVEKPVSDDLDTLTDLLELSGSSVSKVLVGYDLRFCGALDQLKKLVDSGILGQISLANIDAGGYLPYWRPELDYRDLYSANRPLGGGVTLDLVHEMDSMLTLFGQPDYVTATLARKGKLDIDVEDVAQLTFDYETGPIVGIRLDYLRRPFTRLYTLVGSDGTAVWNEQAGEIVVYEGDSSTGEVVWSDQIQNPFELEMRHFLDVVEGSAEPLVSLEEGVTSARLALFAKQASDQGRRLELAQLI